MPGGSKKGGGLKTEQSTFYKMKGHTLPGPFQRKIWPPGSKQFNVDDLIEEEKEKKKKFTKTLKFLAEMKKTRRKGSWIPKAGDFKK